MAGQDDLSSIDSSIDPLVHASSLCRTDMSGPSSTSPRLAGRSSILSATCVLECACSAVTAIATAPRDSRARRCFHARIAPVTLAHRARSRLSRPLSSRSPRQRSSRRLPIYSCGRWIPVPRAQRRPRRRLATNIAVLGTQRTRMADPKLSSRAWARFVGELNFYRVRPPSRRDAGADRSDPPAHVHARAAHRTSGESVRSLIGSQAAGVMFASNGDTPISYVDALFMCTRRVGPRFALC